MAVLAAFSLVYLQGLFDQADHRKAIAAVRAMQTHPGAPTFGEFLAERTKGAVTFSSTLLSGCRGTVRVDAHPESAGLLSYQVDLVSHTVAPLNGAGGRALDDYHARWDAPASGDSPPPSGAPPPQPSQP